MKKKKQGRFVTQINFSVTIIMKRQIKSNRKIKNSKRVKKSSRSRRRRKSGGSFSIMTPKKRDIASYSKELTQRRAKYFQRLEDQKRYEDKINAIAQANCAANKHPLNGYKMSQYDIYMLRDLPYEINNNSFPSHSFTNDCRMVPVEVSPKEYGLADDLEHLAYDPIKHILPSIHFN